MRTTLFASLAVALLLGFTVNVRADIVNQSGIVAGKLPDNWITETVDYFGATSTKKNEATFKIQVGEEDSYTINTSGTIVATSYGNNSNDAQVEVSQVGELLLFAFKNTLTFTFDEPLELTAFVFSMTSFGSGNIGTLTLDYVLADIDGKNAIDGQSSLVAGKNNTAYHFGVFADQEDMYIKSITITHTASNTGEIKFNKLGVTGVDGGDGDMSSTAHAPEPATLLILGLGAVGAGVAARRRKMNK